MTKLANDPYRALHTHLGRLGWSITSLDIDATQRTVQCTLDRSDGRRVTLHLTGRGRGSLTREQRHRKLVRVGRKGEATVVERIGWDLLGRTALSSREGGLYELALYVANNPTPGCAYLAHTTVLAALQGACDVPSARVA